MNILAPLVTVIINNFNYGRFLAPAIDSALAQCYPNLQVIVVDDGSTDDSREVISRYGDRIIPVLKDNGGQASALNAGFAQSRGSWIVLLDSDDLFLSSKVQTLVAYARRFPLAGMIAHNFDFCDEEGNATVFSRPTAAAVRLIDDRAKARRGKFSTYLPPTSALALQRDAAAKIFPLPDDIRISADAFIQMAGLALTPVLLIPESLAIQRIHSKNFCTQRTKTADSFLADCLVTAKVACRIKERFPFLDKIVWKTYGATAYRLMASRSKNAKAARRAVRLEFSRLDRSFSSFYYVARGFVTTLLRDLSNAKTVR